jgi:hypothetical protein
MAFYLAFGTNCYFNFIQRSESFLFFFSVIHLSYRHIVVSTMSRINRCSLSPSIITTLNTAGDLDQSEISYISNIPKLLICIMSIKTEHFPGRLLSNVFPLPQRTMFDIYNITCKTLHMRNSWTMINF